MPVIRAKATKSWRQMLDEFNVVDLLSAISDFGKAAGTSAGAVIRSLTMFG
jgi:hypothetical protein